MLGKVVKKKAASAIEDDAKSFVGTKRLLGDGPSSDVKRLRLLKNPLIEHEGPDDCAVALVEELDDEEVQVGVPAGVPPLEQGEQSMRRLRSKQGPKHHYIVPDAGFSWGPFEFKRIDNEK